MNHEAFGREDGVLNGPPRACYGYSVRAGHSPCASLTRPAYLVWQALSSGAM